MSEHSLVRRMFVMIDAARWTQIPEFFHPEVVYERPGYEPIKGHEAVAHFYREVRIIAQGSHEIIHELIDRDLAACWGRFTGIAHSGAALKERFADVYGLRDGRIRRRTTFFFRPGI